MLTQTKIYFPWISFHFTFSWSNFCFLQIIIFYVKILWCESFIWNYFSNHIFLVFNLLSVQLKMVSSTVYCCILSSFPFLISGYLLRNCWYCKILKISPGAYILKRPFLRGLFLEGLIFGGAYLWREICVSKLIELAL